MVKLPLLAFLASTALLGTAAALTVALQNRSPVTVQVLWLQQTTPLTVLLLCTAGIGFLLGALMTASMLRGRGRRAEKSAKVAKPAAEKA